MYVDICYKVKDEDIFKHIRNHVDTNEIPLAIYTATDNLYINKKTMWNLYDVLRQDGVLAVQTPLWNIGCVTTAAESICGDNKNFDVVIFYNEEIPGHRGVCFYESCIPFILIYKQHKPMAWTLPEPSNLYNSRPNIIQCSLDMDPARPSLIPEISHDMIAKLLAITNFQDVVLLAGSKSLYYANNIKSLCRYVVAFGDNEKSGIRHEGIKMEEL